MGGKRSSRHHTYSHKGTLWAELRLSGRLFLDLLLDSLASLLEMTLELCSCLPQHVYPSVCLFVTQSLMCMKIYWITETGRFRSKGCYQVIYRRYPIQSEATVLAWYPCKTFKSKETFFKDKFFFSFLSPSAVASKVKEGNQDKLPPPSTVKAD